MKYTHSPYGKFYYFNNCSIGRAIAEGKFWEDFYKPYFDRLNERHVVVDVGANIGFFTIYAALRGAWVWAFEVSPDVYQVLEQNVRENEVEINVRCEMKALFDHPCILKLNPEWKRAVGGAMDYEKADNSGGMSLVVDENGVEIDLSRFRSRTLDSYGLMQLNLLKVDTQGADLRVLVGARETIQKHRPVILFEMEPVPARLHGDDESKAMAFFQELDYDVQCLREGSYGVKDFVAVPRG